ncbi:thioester domain-containing protein [Oscillospiraceae bacterium LCP25S3_E3]
MNTRKERFLKGFLGVALSVLTAVSSCPITAFAAEEKSSNMTSDFTFTNNGSVTYSGATLGNFTVKGVNDSKEKNATRQAFCVENSKSNPTRANLGNFQKSSDTKLAKAIYYGWVADSNNATVKKVYGNYANDKTARMVITSAALSQLYSGNSYGNSGNAAIQKSNLIAVAKDSKTTIPNNNISLTDNDLSVSVKNNLQVSQTTQLKGYSGNSVSVTVPKDMTLVNETQNKKVTNGKATIKVNDKFHFEAPLSYSRTINESLKGGMYDFAAYVAKSKSSGIQSIATYCWASNSSSAQVKATFTARLTQVIT